MNARILACGAVLMSLAGGCIPTLNPVYTKKDLFTEKFSLVRPAESAR